MHYFAFDFDGVVVHSANESGETAWRAAHVLWPGQVPARPDDAFRERFARLRPVIETGHEMVPLVGLIARGVADVEILGNFHALAQELVEAEGLERDDMRQRFGAARDAWLASDPVSWCAAQSFYPGVVDAINALDAPCCIITTKEDRFTRVLVEHAGIDVAPERVYALESFEAKGKRSVLEALVAEHPGAQLHFFEDRYATLDRLRDLGNTRLYLVDWGYNTPAERALAGPDADIELLDAARFAAVLEQGGS